MNLFTMHGDNDRMLVGLGLSEENLINLREDHPILCSGKGVNIPFEFFIYWSPDNKMSSFVEKLNKFGFPLPSGAPDGMAEGGGMIWKKD